MGKELPFNPRFDCAPYDPKTHKPAT
jgi:hypothetical protein